MTSATNFSKAFFVDSTFGWLSVGAKHFQLPFFSNVNQGCGLPSLGKIVRLWLWALNINVTLSSAARNCFREGLAITEVYGEVL